MRSILSTFGLTKAISCLSCDRSCSTITNSIDPERKPLLSNLATLAIAKTLKQLENNSYHSSLRTHKLTGNLADVWSYSIYYQYRILFEFIEDPESLTIYFGGQKIK